MEATYNNISLPPPQIAFSADNGEMTLSSAPLPHSAMAPHVGSSGGTHYASWSESTVSAVNPPIPFSGGPLAPTDWGYGNRVAYPMSAGENAVDPDPNSSTLQARPSLPQSAFAPVSYVSPTGAKSPFEARSGTSSTPRVHPNAGPTRPVPVSPANASPAWSSPTLPFPSAEGSRTLHAGRNPAPFQQVTHWSPRSEPAPNTGVPAGYGNIPKRWGQDYERPRTAPCYEASMQLDLASECQSTSLSASDPGFATLPPQPARATINSTWGPVPSPNDAAWLLANGDATVSPAPPSNHVPQSDSAASADFTHYLALLERMNIQGGQTPPQMPAGPFLPQRSAQPPNAPSDSRARNAAPYGTTPRSVGSSYSSSPPLPLHAVAGHPHPSALPSTASFPASSGLDMHSAHSHQRRTRPSRRDEAYYWQASLKGNEPPRQELQGGIAETFSLRDF